MRGYNDKGFDINSVFFSEMFYIISRYKWFVIICEIQWILREDKAGVSCCILGRLKLSFFFLLFFFLLDNFFRKARGSRILCYLAAY